MNETIIKEICSCIFWCTFWICFREWNLFEIVKNIKEKKTNE